MQAPARFAAAILVSAVAGLPGCGEQVELPEPGEGPSLRLESVGGAAVEIETGAFRLHLLDARGRRIASQRPFGLRYATGGAWAGPRREVALGAVRRRVGNARSLALAVSTPRGDAAVTLAWRSARTLEVTLAPPDPAAVTGFCDAWALGSDEAIYGLSERAYDSPAFFGGPPLGEIVPRERGTLDRRGEAVEMYVRPTVAVYAPLYHSSAGYGLYVAGTTPGRYDVGRSDPEALRFCFEAAGAPGRRRHRFFLFAGGPRAIVDEYTALTGRPFVPPAWAFLHWRWRDEHAAGAPARLDGVAMNAQVVEDVRRYEELGIPPGVYLIDRPWSPGPFGFESFRFDEERFPNPEQTFAALARRGWRLAVWSAAFAVGENLEVARARGWLAPGSDLVLDLTNPAARAWWRREHADFARRFSVSAWKLDRGEEHLPSDADDVWADGRNGREVHNDYPRLQASLYADALRDARGEDFVVLMRASYPGAQAYGVPWAGDLTGAHALGYGPGTDLGLRGAIVALGRVGFLGHPFFGSDTGGYYQFEDREVFARWLAFSAFCPIMEIGGHGSHAPWDMPTEPSYDEEMIGIYRRYVALHHALVPYVDAFARGPARRGVPVARALVFDHPDDPHVRDLWDQFLFGDDVLVAPVWRRGERSRDVYLPAGRWEDFWDAAVVHEGPRTLRVDAPLDRIPVFVRAGADVPGRPDRPRGGATPPPRTRAAASGRTPRVGRLR